jgi:hypothetical protein
VKSGESAELLVSCLSYSSVVKMEEIRSSEVYVDFQRTTRGCTPEDRTIHNHSFCFAWLNVRLHVISIVLNGVSMLCVILCIILRKKPSRKAKCRKIRSL